MNLTPQIISDLSTLSAKECALKYHVTPETICNWRRRAGINLPKNNALDYPRMISLINEGKTTTDIMKLLKCSRSPIDDQKRRMGKGSGRRGKGHVHLKHEVHVEVAEPCIPPEMRPRLIIERKMARFSKAHRAAWVGGMAYQQTLGEL